MGLNMSKVRFRLSTDLLARLGEELNPGPDQSILELVKNSYDADARLCTVELDQTTTPGGTITISDNGDGMSASTIVDGWLVLGRSRKRKHERTRLGRVPAGSKGLGRLAALRMGETAILHSRSRNDPETEHSLSIDWTKFDSAEVVEDVDLNIESRVKKDGKYGTEAILKGVRSALSRSDVERLARAMLLLADPFGGKNSFRPVLRVREFRDLEKLVQNQYFKHADYHLRAVVDRVGHGRARVLDWHGAELFRADHGELARRHTEYHCPRLQFDLWAFILARESFAGREVTIDQVREWLAAFGGVHLYENGLRVAPYGNAGNDWLEMNLARSRSPEERPSTNNAIGRLWLDNSEDALKQKTDRSGYVESEGFREVVRFAKDSLSWMARKRMEVALARRAVQRQSVGTTSRQARKELEEVLSRVPGKSRSHVVAAVKEYDKARKKEVDVLRREVQLYRTLGTAGITAATFAHESSGNALKVLGQATRSLERRALANMSERAYREQLAQPVSLIQQATGTLGALGNITLSLVDHDKRRVGRIELHNTVRGLMQLFAPFLEERKVSIELGLTRGRNPTLRASESAVESILANLVNNSLYWLEQTHDRDRVLRVATSIDAERVQLRVADSGPGIRGIGLSEVWLPGQTTRPNGTGLGLTIVYDVAKDLGGTVEATATCDLGGAEFCVALPILGES